MAAKGDQGAAESRTATPGGNGGESPGLEIYASPQFPAWLVEQRVSLAFTTYQAGRLFLLGVQPNGRLSAFERIFRQCMGLCRDGESLWLSSLYQVWRLDNILSPGQQQDGYDRLYVPRVGHTTGALDIHDIAVDGEGRLVFVNTLFSCLATLAERDSFAPLWQPPFISDLVPEDRCHLNGLAMDDGRPAYVTAVSRSDVADGWRDRREDGGCVVEVASGEVVATGLSMPHSPRLHDGRLWLLDSGSGRFGWIDTGSGRFEPLCFCPGYARGLAFVGDQAVIGLSKPRRNKTFDGLALDAALAEKDVAPRCGFLVVDLESGETLHWLRIEGVFQEIYDVAVLPGVRRPKALGFRSDEIARAVTVGEAASL